MVPSSIQTQDNLSKPSDSPTFPLKSFIRYVETNVSVNKFEYTSFEVRNSCLESGNHSNVTTTINDILESNSFAYHFNGLTYIIQHNILYWYFKLLGKSTSTLCNFKINYFDNMENLYISSGFVHYQQQFKHNVEPDIVSTPNTTT